MTTPARPGRVPDPIFVSHSHKDNEWCREFVATLTAAGWDVWYDEQGLHGGAAFISVIQTELAARPNFMPILTPDALASEWVQRELQLAMLERKHIIPVLHKDTPQAGGFLKLIQWIDVVGMPAAVAAAKVAYEMGYPLDRRDLPPPSPDDPRFPKRLADLGIVEMNMTKHDHLNSQNPAAAFRAVYCSGFFVPDQSLLTAMCLIFDKVHILNNMDYVQSYADQLSIPRDGFSPYAPERHFIRMNDQWVPLTPQTSDEWKAAEAQHYYMLQARKFWHENEQLFGEVLTSSLFPEGHLYYAPPSDSTVNMKFSVSYGGSETELGQLIQSGYIPLAGVGDGPIVRGTSIRRSEPLAALLAMQSVKLVLPTMKPTSPDKILEARSRLNDELYFFRAAMLRLAGEIKTRIDAGMPDDEIVRECEDLVQTTVRPTVIELTQKMTKDKWFQRIVGAFQDEWTMVTNRSSLTVSDLVIIGLETVGRVIGSLSQHPTVSSNPSMAYLLLLNKHLNQQR